MAIRGDSVSARGETVQPHGGLRVFIGDDLNAWFISDGNPSEGEIRHELTAMRQTEVTRVAAIDEILRAGKFKKIGRDIPDPVPPPPTPRGPP